MVIQLTISVLLGILGSYVSFFKPTLLSKNIKELSSFKVKWIVSISSIVVVLGLLIQLNLEGSYAWVEFFFLSVFYFVAVIDLYSKIIPNRLVLILLSLSVLQLVLQFEFEFLLSGSAIFGILTTANLLTNKFFKKNLFGWGDVKLIGVLGLYLGWEVLWVVYIAIIFGGLLSIIGIASKQISKNTKIPIAMFLLFGILIFSLKCNQAYFYS